jgi:hypothetical protein
VGLGCGGWTIRVEGVGVRSIQMLYAAGAARSKNVWPAARRLAFYQGNARAHRGQLPPASSRSFECRFQMQLPANDLAASRPAC